MFGDCPPTAAGSAVPSVTVLRSRARRLRHVFAVAGCYASAVRFFGVCYIRCTDSQFNSRILVFSSQRADSRADCYFALRASERRSFMASSNSWCACWLACDRVSLWLLTPNVAGSDRTASVRGRRGFCGGGGWQPCSTGPLRPGRLCAAAVRVLSLRELREPGSRLAQGPVRPLEQNCLKIG